MSFRPVVCAKLDNQEYFRLIGSSLAPLTVKEIQHCPPILKSKDSPSNYNSSPLDLLFSVLDVLAVLSDASSCFSVVMFKQSTEPLLASNPSYINISRLP